MAQPSVRTQAMANKSQQGVWDRVNSANAEAAVIAGAGTQGGPSSSPSSSSYARNMNSAQMQREVDEVAAPVQRSYQSVIRQLRDQKAVGVVVAVNGEIIWADIFASPAMLEKYWPKLVRSYAAEALTHRGSTGTATLKEAQGFLARLEGSHEQTDTEPGVYRHTEITGSGYKVFELTSLLPGTGFDVHVSKMAD